MANAIAIIGARLNSSRLPGKQLFDLAGEPIISRIFERLEQVGSLDEIILATTSDSFNQPLVNWAQAAGKKVHAYSGDVNDLVGRVSAVLAEHPAEILVYVCGDSPLIEPKSIDSLIQILKADPAAKQAQLASPDGRPLIHEGFAVFRRDLWEMLDAASVTPEEREHVGLAINRLDPPPGTAILTEDEEYSRIQHRLSVDTLSDYIFMQEVFSRWYRENAANTTVSLRWVIGELQRDTALRDINADVHQKQVGEPGVRVVMAAMASQSGHPDPQVWVWFARLFQDRFAAAVEIWKSSGQNAGSMGYLNLFPVRELESEDKRFSQLTRIQPEADVDILVVPVAREWMPDLPVLLHTCKARGIHLIGLSESGFHDPRMDLSIEVPRTMEEGIQLFEEQIHPEVSSWLSDPDR